MERSSKRVLSIREVTSPHNKQFTITPSTKIPSSDSQHYPDDEQQYSGNNNNQNRVNKPNIVLMKYYWSVTIALLKDVFLPQGYPDTVSSDYLTYQKWDTLQAFCSTLNNLLCTRALFEAVGVGKESVTPASAVVQWIFKDGTGMIGRILFAWFQGSALDSNAKTWRYVADILNDLAMLLELLSPFFPSIFLPLVCLAALFRSICGVCGGATRATFTLHQARNNNMADVSAKDGSQETAVNLTGLVIGAWLIPVLEGRIEVTWILFFALVSCHLWANWNGVRCVRMSKLNRQRMEIILESWGKEGKVLSTEEVRNREKVLWWESINITGPKIILGAKMESVLAGQNEEERKKLLQLFEMRSEKNWVIVCVDENGTILVKEDELNKVGQRGRICVILRNEVTVDDIHESYVESWKVREAKVSSTIHLAQMGSWNELRLQLLKKGWEDGIELMMLNPGEARYDWKIKSV